MSLDNAANGDEEQALLTCLEHIRQLLGQYRFGGAIILAGKDTSVSSLEFPQGSSVRMHADGLSLSLNHPEDCQMLLRMADIARHMSKSLDAVSARILEEVQTILSSRSKDVN